MQRYRWVGHIYTDWFREPATPLESSWRWPMLLRSAQHFIKEKFGLRLPHDYYSVKEGWLYVRTDWLRLLAQPQMPFALIRFLLKLTKAKPDFEHKILPEYNQLLSSWRKESDSLNDRDDFALWHWANSVMEADAKYAVAIVYVGVYGFLFDFLLQRFYRKFVKDEPTGYHELLAGFRNRTYEFNEALFELSQKYKNDKTGFENAFSYLLLQFGLEKSDWELALPVLGEHPQTIMHMIQTYQNHPELDPKLRLRTAAAKRQKKFEYALGHLKLSFLTRPIFKWIVRWAQEYVPLRETRQHYIGAGTYFIRQALKLLEYRLGLDQDMIFYLKKEEIDNAIEGKFEMTHCRRITQERYNLRESQKEHLPHE